LVVAEFEMSAQFCDLWPISVIQWRLYTLLLIIEISGRNLLFIEDSDAKYKKVGNKFKTPPRSCSNTTSTITKQVQNVSSIP
jgi:hypothetical protein